jgi:retron-type reverse transcriptase
MEQKGKFSNFDFAQIFGKTREQVDAILAEKEKHIHKFDIPKKDGSPRHVIAPDGELKYIQKMVYFRFLRRYSYHPATHGFVPKRGIVTNAQLHVGAKSVGKIDIEKFFDTISEKHLKNCLFGNKNICRYCKKYTRMLDGQCHPSLYKNKIENFPYKCEEIKAVFIPNYCEETGYESLFKRVIDVCTYNGTTAQGFPTSPMLANIVMRGFDKAMVNYCEPLNIKYSRYADDLAFSSNTMTSKELLLHTKTKASRELWAFGFKPKKEKTRYRSRGSRLKICGIVINEKTSVQRSTVHLFRAKVHHAIHKYPNSTTRSRLRELKGWASFLMSVDHDKGKKYMNQLVEFENSKFPKEKGE